VLVYKFSGSVIRGSDWSASVQVSVHCHIQAGSMLGSLCFMGCILLLRFLSWTATIRSIFCLYRFALQEGHGWIFVGCHSMCKAFLILLMARCGFVAWSSPAHSAWVTQGWGRHTYCLTVLAVLLLTSWRANPSRLKDMLLGFKHSVMHACHNVNNRIKVCLRQNPQHSGSSVDVKKSSHLIKR